MSGLINISISKVLKQKKLINSIVLGAYSCLTVIYTFPLILHLNEQLIGIGKSDNLEYVWKIWWVAHSLFDLNKSPMLLTNINYPYGYSLANGDLTVFNTFLMSPITILFGPIITYNVSIFLSFVLSGFFTYLFVYRLTESRFAAFFAGFLFSFSSFRMARVSAQLPIIGSQWIVLFLYFIELFICDISLRSALLAGLAIGLSGFSSVYFPAMLLLITPPYLVIRLSKKHGFGYIKSNLRQFLRGFAIFLFIALSMLLPTVYPYMEIQKSGGTIVPISDIVFWSADITNYLTPNPYQFVWKDWIVKIMPAFFSRGYFLNEYVVGLSFVGLIFALYGFMTSRKNERAGWGWWFLSAFILSLGPVMKVFNRLITMNVSPGTYKQFTALLAWFGEHSLAHEILQLGSVNQIFLPLPALFIRWFIPGFLSMRSWSRFSVFFVLGVAIWAGYGLNKYILSETNQNQVSMRLKSKILLGILVFAAFFETYDGPQPLITPSPRLVDSWLAGHDIERPIIQMPLLSALSGPQMYYTQYHHHPIVGGYGTYLPFAFSRDYPELTNFPSDDSLDLLRDWGMDKDQSLAGVMYILVDETEVSVSDPLWDAIKNQPRLEEITVLDGVHVYGIRN